MRRLRIGQGLRGDGVLGEHVGDGRIGIGYVFDHLGIAAAGTVAEQLKGNDQRHADSNGHLHVHLEGGGRQWHVGHHDLYDRDYDAELQLSGLLYGVRGAGRNPSAAFFFAGQEGVSGPRADEGCPRHRGAKRHKRLRWRPRRADKNVGVAGWKAQCHLVLWI